MSTSTTLSTTLRGAASELALPSPVQCIQVDYPDSSTHFLKDHFLEGIPVNNHLDEWPSYFEVLIPNSGNPNNPAYWDELD